MQYLGGKHRLAKKLVAAMRTEMGDAPVWEPFCGGLSMTVEFARRSTGAASDAHPALMSLYAACRAGWVPPTHVTEEDYAAARALPASNPLHGFCMFGCSFGGKAWGGYAKPDARCSPPLWYSQSSRKAVLRDCAATSHWTFAHTSFFDHTPGPLGAFIYCDPPYEGTTGYRMPFDHALFWRRCQEWAACGVPVYVSEFSCPVPHRLVLEIERPRAVSASTGTCVDRLYQVLPL